MCFVKKLYGNKGRYNNVFKPWVDKFYEKRAEEIHFDPAFDSGYYLKTTWLDKILEHLGKNEED